MAWRAAQCFIVKGNGNNLGRSAGEDPGDDPLHRFPGVDVATRYLGRNLDFLNRYSLAVANADMHESSGHKAAGTASTAEITSAARIISATRIISADGIISAGSNTATAAGDHECGSNEAAGIG
jgi:hypothetical protein